MVQFLGETGARKRPDDVERIAYRIVYTLFALNERLFSKNAQGKGPFDRPI